MAEPSGLCHALVPAQPAAAPCPPAGERRQCDCERSHTAPVNVPPNASLRFSAVQGLLQVRLGTFTTLGVLAGAVFPMHIVMHVASLFLLS